MADGLLTAMLFRSQLQGTPLQFWTSPLRDGTFLGYLAELFHQFLFFPQLLHLPPNCKLWVYRLQVSLRSQKHCNGKGGKGLYGVPSIGCHNTTHYSDEARGFFLYPKSFPDCSRTQGEAQLLVEAQLTNSKEARVLSWVVQADTSCSSGDNKPNPGRVWVIPATIPGHLLERGPSSLLLVTYSS